MKQPSSRNSDGEPSGENLDIHPTLFQRILAFLGVLALIVLFVALLYLLRTIN